MIGRGRLQGCVEVESEMQAWSVSGQLEMQACGGH